MYSILLDNTKVYGKGQVDSALGKFKKTYSANAMNGVKTFTINNITSCGIFIVVSGYSGNSCNVYIFDVHLYYSTLVVGKRTMSSSTGGVDVTASLSNGTLTLTTDTLSDERHCTVIGVYN